MWARRRGVQQDVRNPDPHSRSNGGLRHIDVSNTTHHTPNRLPPADGRHDYSTTCTKEERTYIIEQRLARLGTHRYATGAAWSKATIKCVPTSSQNWVWTIHDPADVRRLQTQSPQLRVVQGSYLAM